MRPYLRVALTALSLILLVLLTPRLALAPAPLCDVTCEPDPGSGSYQSTIKARAESYNARGRSVTIYRPAVYPGPSAHSEELPGSESYNYAIPILNLPGRNGLDLNLTLYYNSRVWTIDKAANTATFNGDRDWPGYGFRLGFGYIEGPFTDDFGTTYLLTEPDGGKRELRLNGSNGFYESADSSFIDFNSTSKVLRRKDGTQWEYQQVGTTTLFRPIKIKDTNGNYITIAYRTDPGFSKQAIDVITDTLGRLIYFQYNNGQLSSITNSPPIAPTKVYAIFTWGQMPLNYSFTGLTVVDSPTPSGTQINVITSCRYNSGSGPGYNFTYGNWGIVSRIEQHAAGTFGALRSYVQYSYPDTTPALSDHPTFTHQTVYDGVNTDTWTYAVTKSGGLVTSMAITAPITGTVTTTSLSNGLPTIVTIGTLRTITNAWSTDSNGVNPRITAVTATLNDITPNQQSKVEFSYTTNGNVSEVREFDYGLALKRKTQTDYLNTASYTDPVTGKHILDRPIQVRVYDSAALKSRTDFEYDISTGLTGVSGASNHDDTNFGTGFSTRGNLTKIARYSNAAGPSGAVARYFYYDTLGNLIKADLDCCQQRQWTFTSTHQYAYPMTITSGPAGGPQLTISRTYNGGNGLVVSATDENNKTTLFQYDYLDRLQFVTRPDNVQFQTSYDDAAALPKVTTTTPINPTSNLVQETTTDGLGRTTKQQTRSAVGGTLYSTVQTEYDALGRVTKSYNPCASESCASDWTQYTYDALGRPTVVTPPGSQGSYNYGYSGNAVTGTDPAGKQRRTFTDALGRLVQVDEPGPDSPAPGSGWVNIVGEAQWICDPEGPPLPNCFKIYDFGTVWITVNGLTKSVSYNRFSTASSIATALRNAINGDSNYPVTAGGSGGAVTLTAKTTGPNTNYPLSAGSTTYMPEYFSVPSFGGDPSGSTLTGGSDGSAITLSTPYVTSYFYDPLDNLTQVIQGAQQRTFVYDSMGRLTSATTPEASTVTYTYTNFSQVSTRTDARNVVTTYSYDNLNRLSGVSYTVPAGVAATPAVGFTYGTSATSNNNGRLVTMTDGVGSETYSYEQLGRITQVSKLISGATYNSGYAYNYAGELTSITYPSTRVVTQAYDAIGRLNQASSSGTNYISAVQYNGANLPESFTYGNGVVADPGYNSRMALATLRYSKGAVTLLDLAYSYTSAGQPGNNGQITRIQDNTGTPEAGRTVDYTYDEWSRLKTAVTTGSASYPQWGLSWDYDRYGNRKNQNVTAGSAPAPQLAISTTTNRITSSGYTYDAAGNLTNDAVNTYSYDGENRMVSMPPGSPYPTLFNVHDGAGLRVKKLTNSGSTTTVYIFSGAKVIAEYVNGSLSKEYIYAGSQLIATLNSSGTPTYVHPDQLSARVFTDSAGAKIGERGHLPFGEVRYDTMAADKWKFTTYERDSESGLDYAMFRFDSTRLGRFQSPDPIFGTARDPQSLNRYAYVRNDPINLIDPLGLYCVGIHWFRTRCFSDGSCITEYLGFEPTWCSSPAPVVGPDPQPGGGERQPKKPNPPGLRPRTEQEYQDCVRKAQEKRDKKNLEGRILQGAGGALTLIGAGATFVTWPILAEAVPELLLHGPGAFAFLTPPGIAIVGVGAFYMGSQVIAQARDQFNEDLEKCAGAVPQNPGASPT